MHSKGDTVMKIAASPDFMSSPNGAQQLVRFLYLGPISSGGRRLKKKWPRHQCGLSH